MTADYEQLILIFTSIIYEALPFVVLGVVIAGFLEEFVPQQFIGGLFQGRGLPPSWQRRLPAELAAVARIALLGLQVRVVAIALGGVLGLLFPMCECGIIPVMRRLIRKGVPLSVCVCYVLAGPVVNLVVLTSTYAAFWRPNQEDYIFGGPVVVMLLRAGLAYLVAFVTSLVVEWQYQKHGNSLLTPSLAMDQAHGLEDEAAGKPRPSLFQRLGNVTETALHDFVDIMAFLVLGACLAAIGRTSLDRSQLEERVQASPAVAILIMMGIAIAICLCSEADAFVAVNFSTAWAPASKIAFLVLGPMLDFKLFLMYTRVFRQRLIWTIITAVVVQVFLYTLVLHYVWDGHGYSEAFLKRNAAGPQSGSVLHQRPGS